MVRSLGVAKDDEFHLKSRGVIEDIAAKISARMQASTQPASKTSMLSIFSSGGSVSSKVATSIETELKNSSAEFTNLFAAQLYIRAAPARRRLVRIGPPVPDRRYSRHVWI
jgi:alpha/beta superfamily hydrolase